MVILQSLKLNVRLICFMEWDSNFVFYPKGSKLGIYYDCIVTILNFEKSCLSSVASQIQWWVLTVLFFVRDFF